MTSTKKVDVTKPRLLLVEDNPKIQGVLRDVLRPLCTEAAVFRTADEAVEWLRVHPDGWDLAVVDLFLQRGNGFQVLRQCATRGAAQSVVVLSNYTREPARSSALDQGASAVFDKSFEMDQFLAYCDGVASRLSQRELQPA
jgi:DNA-binding response OmpR family regulator